MKQEIAKKKAAYPTELTEMQRRFCEYLIMNEGRTTGKDAAIDITILKDRSTYPNW